MWSKPHAEFGASRIDQFRRLPTTSLRRCVLARSRAGARLSAPTVRLVGKSDDGASRRACSNCGWSHWPQTRTQSRLTTTYALLVAGTLISSAAERWMVPVSRLPSSVPCDPGHRRVDFDGMVTQQLTTSSLRRMDVSRVHVQSLANSTELLGR